MKIDSKMVTTMLILLYNSETRDNISSVQRTDSKRTRWNFHNCHLIRHKTLNGYAYSLRETVIHCFPTNCLSCTRHWQCYYTPRRPKTVEISLEYPQPISMPMLSLNQVTTVLLYFANLFSVCVLIVTLTIKDFGHKGHNILNSCYK